MREKEGASFIAKRQAKVTDDDTGVQEGFEKKNQNLRREERGKKERGGESEQGGRQEECYRMYREEQHQL